MIGILSPVVYGLSDEDKLKLQKDLYKEYRCVEWILDAQKIILEKHKKEVLKEVLDVVIAEYHDYGLEIFNKYYSEENGFDPPEDMIIPKNPSDIIDFFDLCEKTKQGETNVR